MEVKMNYMEFISNLGFPIVMSIILITRIETKLDDLTQSINKLIERMDNISRVKDDYYRKNGRFCHV